MANNPTDRNQRPASPQDLGKRVIELEGQLMHLQKSYDDLNSVLVDQSKQFLRLERAILSLENQLKEIVRQNREPRDPLSERPPHY